MAGAIDRLVSDEAVRREEFPVCRDAIFLAHAAVTVLPRVAADAMARYLRGASVAHQESGDIWARVDEARALAGELVGMGADEVALLGPTALGLSLFALGIEWRAGDEVVCHGDDYPANVYPWLELRRRGVEVRVLRPGAPGEITPELVRSALGARTRLVALSSCHYLSGYRLDVGAVGALLRERGILFALDAIQTLGAFPLGGDRVDLLSADSHKWMLGPMAAGIVCVRREHFERVRPALLGAWNVQSPDFVAGERIEFYHGARRYEPGVLNVAGIIGMRASLELLSGVGIGAIAARLMTLKAMLVQGLRRMGCGFCGPTDGENASAITSFDHPALDMARAHASLACSGIVTSLRKDRSGRRWLRLSPHFYNTEAELETVLRALREMVGGRS